MRATRGRGLLGLMSVKEEEKRNWIVLFRKVRLKGVENIAVQWELLWDGLGRVKGHANKVERTERRSSATEWEGVR
jgi:hypothetical protein